jgi:hypothetical protein
MLKPSISRAICDEIGERLGAILKPDTSELPPRLRQLLEKLAQQDVERDVPFVLAPTIAPSLEDLCTSSELPAHELVN